MAFLQSGDGEGPYYHGQGRQVIADVPPVVFCLIGALAAAHIARMLMPVAMAEAALKAWSFVPAHVASVAGLAWPAAAKALATFLTYVFVQTSWSNLGIDCLLVLAFGPVVARRYGWAGFLLLFALGAVSGAALYLAVAPHSALLLAGGDGAVGCIALSAIRMIGPGFETSERPPLAPFYAGRVLFFAIAWMAAVAALVGGLAVLPIAGGILAAMVFPPLFERARP
ncbi:MAG TPA: rhomboid family intramembrane serine protease [Rhizomicrobium sp.]|nr:rhomboid family intramembrane serine protease [Rhizomicrobium sp.]